MSYYGENKTKGLPTRAAKCQSGMRSADPTLSE
jgi:hypothetical protein